MNWENFWELVEMSWMVLSFAILPLIGAIIVLFGMAFGSVIVISMGVFTLLSPWIVIDAYKILQKIKSKKTKKK